METLSGIATGIKFQAPNPSKHGPNSVNREGARVARKTNAFYKDFIQIYGFLALIAFLR